MLVIFVYKTKGMEIRLHVNPRNFHPRASLITARFCGRVNRIWPWQLHPGQNQRCESI